MAVMTENTRRIAELQRELASNPASRQFYQLGELLRRDGRSQEASAVLHSGLAHHPRYVAAWVALGRASLEAGQASGAVAGLQEALGLDPQNPVAWRLLGEAHMALGDRPLALEAMQRCLELVPGDDVLQAAVEALTPDAAAPAAEASAPAATGGPFREPPPPLPVEPRTLVLDAPIAEASAVTGRVEIGKISAAARADAPFDLPAATEAARDGSEPFAAAAAEAPATVAESPGTTQRRPAIQPFVTAPMALEKIAQAPEGPWAQPSEPAEPPSVEVEPTPAPPVSTPIGAADSDLFTAPEIEAGPTLLKGLLRAPSDRARAEQSQPPASLTLARLYVQQQAMDEAILVLERLLEREPGNIEARDLLALVRDMMAPLPEAPPPLSLRERRIAALQRWLASLTLGRERAVR
jgi:cytochrome c-type biogenesis protein CcmH/NrfG